jgi:hypothetical protein
VSEIILHRSGYHFTLSIANHQHRTLLHFDSLGASLSHSGFLRIADMSSKTWKAMMDPRAVAAAAAARPNDAAAAAAVGCMPWGGCLAVPLPGAAVQRGGLNTCGPHAMFVALSYVANACEIRSSCAARPAAAVEYSCLATSVGAVQDAKKQQQQQQDAYAERAAAVQGALQQCYVQGLQGVSSTADVD